MFHLIKILTKDENENIVWDKTFYILHKSGKVFSIFARVKSRSVGTGKVGEMFSESWQPLAFSR